MKLGATGQAGESIWRSVFPFMWRRQETEIEARAEELLERFNMGHMRDEFADAWLELDRDPEVRVIVHTGNGRAFQTGVDVSDSVW